MLNLLVFLHVSVHTQLVKNVFYDYYQIPFLDLLFMMETEVMHDLAPIGFWMICT